MGSLSETPSYPSIATGRGSVPNRRRNAASQQSRQVREHFGSADALPRDRQRAARDVPIDRFAVDDENLIYAQTYSVSGWRVLSFLWRCIR